ncbi:beta-propeller fold lactonase family protein [Paraburkholderia adhaesiva]|uniref:beta-propeller fold lactonase family protein n=1 Tax=Paraburkholderia adhaesiva TaxID=2883244 RepID=UPI001F21E5FC|nr:beta-propeller fold lactonase family protein [Paraburkholderia adhaesiva]
MLATHLPIRKPVKSIAPAAVIAAAFALAASGAHAATPTAYVTSETAGVGVIDLNQMSLAKTFPVGADGPRGLSLNADGTRLLLANKNTGDLAVIDTQTGKVVERVKIGKNPEYVRVHNGYAYVTYEPGQDGGKQGADDDDNALPAEIAVIDEKTWRVIRSVKSGHETEGVEFSRDGNTMLVTNEGDDTLSVYDAQTGAPLRTVTLPAGGRPRGIKASPDGSQYVVTLESSNRFVVLDAHDFHVLNTVDTKLGPYGVAFDPAGKRLFVAAARDATLQVFDAHNYAHLADVPVGKRCWHFSFTPDGARLLLACGRSNAVYVIDAQTYETLQQIGDLPLAWGIVTWPSSVGSIESR